MTDDDIFDEEETQPGTTCFFCDDDGGWYDDEDMYVACPYCQIERTKEPEEGNEIEDNYFPDDTPFP